jgi:tetratricopeptide (TPR) repeat protein
MRKKGAIVLAALVGLTIVSRPGWPNSGSTQDSAFIQALSAAKAELQAGVNRWESETLQRARDMFLGLLLKQDKPIPYLHYYIALADYRLATFHLSSGSPADADRFVTEGEQYLEKVMEAEPGFGEAFSLYGYILGLEIALHEDRAMTLGFKSMAAIDQGIEKDPSNPRTHLLKGMYLPYMPEAFGGGAEKAIPYLEKAVELFEKESPTDPVKPSWGHDEAYAFLGSAYKTIGNTGKAREMVQKALALNPGSSFAQRILESLDKSQ